MVTDALPGAVSGWTGSSQHEIIGARMPTAGPLIYAELKMVEDEARAKLKRGLEVRQVLSPYKGNLEFQTYVKKFDYEAGWTRNYDHTTPYTQTLTLIGLIDRADQDLRQARDLYAYLLVYAPEHRFRADNDYTVSLPEGYTEPLCGETDKEDPDPPDPLHSGQVLDPVVDWCNFSARLRQSVREAANLRLIFGQQFMVDALGLHFSGTGLLGGEDAVRKELAQMRAAKHQYELAEQGLAEALGRALGSGCYVSDFYTQSEWSLLSRAIENQETAQHHIAVRLSYLDIASPDNVPQAHAVARDAFRQASTEGYIKLIGMASLGAAQPLGVGCDKGERPDGLLAAEMAANLLETRRKAREMTEGRNVFGFDVSFTPARPYKTTSSGDPGLWNEADDEAEWALELQATEIGNTRLFDESQKELREEVDEIRKVIDARIEAASGCGNTGNDQAWYACVDNQIALLNTCMTDVTSDDISDTNPFDTCMNRSEIKNSEAKQALLDLRAVYMGYWSIKTEAEDIDKRVRLSEDRNAIVTGWLAASGAVETAARVSEATLNMISCFDPATKLWMNASCGVAGGANIALQTAAGAVSTAADVVMEDAEHTKEVQNLLLNQSELLIDAYAANQQYHSKQAQFEGLLEGLKGDLVEAQRQRAYFQHSPANDPSFRIVRDSSRLVLAKQMEKAARVSYLAARRAEYECVARLSASNFRISDIYRARIAEDILNYLSTGLR
jgi:hypothetical protein